MSDSPTSPKRRSPIEQMVDAACGFDPNNPPPQPKPLDFEAIGAAMCEVCDAAKLWRRNHTKGTKRLRAAVKRYVDMGG